MFHRHLVAAIRRKVELATLMSVAGSAKQQRHRA
jgi:hypothetical protein